MSGRYRLRRRLGRGGMAEVFEAIATGERGFTRTVAVKRMLPEVGRMHDDMFLDEARIASHLHHANIVAVLDYGLANQLPFQVLEYVDGLDLQTALALHQAPLPVELALHICSEVAHALSHAHAAALEGRPLGIVHRDVKPANILVSYDGDVKLSDFGIAFARDRLQKTEVGIAKGTREYMSPEQWIAGEVDARSDVFSLGCVLHALATGQSPMGQTRAEELLEGHELSLDAALPEDVAPIVARATRRQKRDRYAGAAEMAEALGEALGRRPPQQPKALMQKWMRALPPSEREPLFSPPMELVVDGEKLPVRRRPWWIAGLAAAGLAGTLFWRWPAEIPMPLAPPPPVVVPSASPEPVVVKTVAPPPVVDKPIVVKPKRRPPPEPPPPAVAAPLANGHLLVSGQGALRAEIFVDGRSSGFAPKLLQLPSGPHEVELLLQGGARLRRQVTLAESHTASSPIRWLVP